MITRSKLVDQLREHQIRSHRATWLALTTFSPKPYIATRFWIITMAKSQCPFVCLDFGSSPWQNLRRDAIVALSHALIFCFLKISCCISLYFKIFGLSAVFIILGILLPICLKISRGESPTDINF
ncbi:hypothetical protein ACMD2_20458 [Ananas comosus]|uniref:Uncharacterized protein n=1 Tax=Ananas comosus TaxID=4615 RepID=A0A199W9D1_ANACO|nr:hypothetical protein ACMD2_20458 [Ananas comosus]